MKIVSPEQMKEIDNMAINSMDIPGIILMENAALKVVEAADKLVDGLKEKNILIFAGKGNNGGDALAIARHAFNLKANVKLYLFSSDYSGDAKINYDIIEKMGIGYKYVKSDDDLDNIKIDLKTADLIIDGIFGTGLKGIISGLINRVIDLINSANKKVIAIDIPSGMDGLTGKILGVCVNANKTVTFALPKSGFYKWPGKAYLGELDVVDIGIPENVIDKLNINLNLIEKDFIKSIFPKRYRDSNKGTYGKLFLISGSTGMTGAGILSAKAAYKTGAGLVYLGVPNSLISIYETILPESVAIPFDGEKGYFKISAAKDLWEFSQKVDVVGIGPGMSARENLVDLLENIIDNVQKPMVIDADGLNLLAKKIDILHKRKAKVVITPHPGEMARLTGRTIQEIQSNRIEIASEFSKKWGIIVVLKGDNSLVALPNGQIYINVTGNNGMSTAGSGDVLTGVIMSLIGQGKTPEEAAIIGTYIHGFAGDLASDNLSEYGVMASDIVEKLPVVIKLLIEE